MSNRSDDDAPILDPELMSAETPAGIDRRSFIVRSAMIGSVAVLSGSKAGDREGDRRPGRFSTSPQTARQALPRPRGRQEVQGAGDDHRRGVLQGRPRTVELAHHRADADHVQLLSALRKAAAGPTRQGHRPQGASLRQLERHREGARHRARRSGRHHRQGAGNGRPEIPRRSRRQSRSDVPGEAGYRHLQRLDQGHHLRCAQGRLPAPQHDDLQAHGRRYRAPRAGVLLGRRRLHRMEGLSAPEEGAAEIPLRDDAGAAEARRGEQALGGAGGDGQRGGGLGQERGRRSTPFSTRSRP